MRKTEAELLEELDRFLAETKPKSTSVLTRHRALIVRMHLNGMNKEAMFKFLSQAGVIHVARSSFYRWLSMNIDFKEEARKQLSVDLATSLEPSRATPADQAVAFQAESLGMAPEGEAKSTALSRQVSLPTTAVKFAEEADANDSDQAVEPLFEVLGRKALIELADMDPGTVADRALLYVHPNKKT